MRISTLSLENHGIVAYLLSECFYIKAAIINFKKTTCSGILNQLRDAYFICTAHEWKIQNGKIQNGKIQNGKIEIVFFIVIASLTVNCYVYVKV